tara:strand:+ start:522 stop:761 length:240 start_codon:yes stop_codon:yes gene_type:complete
MIKKYIPILFALLPLSISAQAIRGYDPFDGGGGFITFIGFVALLILLSGIVSIKDPDKKYATGAIISGLLLLFIAIILY